MTYNVFGGTLNPTQSVSRCTYTLETGVNQGKRFSFWVTSSRRPPTGVRLWTPLGDYRPQDYQILATPIRLLDEQFLHSNCHNKLQVHVSMTRYMHVDSSRNRN